ncbi:hypothetical protein [Burkholderia ambifaria]|uniref:hypothetical protein n=1 Tax=Burkholderia ambifaria TaxID=152480 RepID=UPI0015900603|nr:hypothetical protein [Burkholderia ambifaria]
METTAGSARAVFMDEMGWLAALYGGTLCAVAGIFEADVCHTTIVVRLEEAEQVIRFYADVGLPRVDDELAACRRALQCNLVRGVRWVTFGMHPESGRLVATAVLPVQIDWKSGVVARAVVESLLACVADMRHEYSFFGSR